jgi:site-specific DNA-methyltransferase (adenine-specific)
VWTIRREYHPGQKKNRNQLPSKLLARMIQLGSRPGDLVCDFFLGSFSTARASRTGWDGGRLASS